MALDEVKILQAFKDHTGRAIIKKSLLASVKECEDICTGRAIPQNMDLKEDIELRDKMNMRVYTIHDIQREKLAILDSLISMVDDCSKYSEVRTIE